MTASFHCYLKGIQLESAREVMFNVQCDKKGLLGISNLFAIVVTFDCIIFLYVGQFPYDDSVIQLKVRQTFQLLVEFCFWRLVDCVADRVRARACVSACYEVSAA